MEHLNFFILFLLFLPPFSIAQYNCPFAFCGSTAFIIRFPFRMIGQQPAICGYPGFDLRCNRQGTMLLTIPKSGDFSVRTIDYQSQTIQVYDPSGCSASRLMNLDLSGSPFSVSATRNYTLLICPVQTTMARFPTVDCLSNSTYSTLATTSVSFVTSMMANRTGCRVMGPLEYPISRYQDREGLTSDLNLDISLTWDNPNCQDCSADGGTCGYTNTSMQEIACFNDMEKSKNRAMIAMVIVSVGMALPAIAASVAIACYICRKDRRVSTWMARNTTPDAATMPPETAATLWQGSLTIGLDQSTIESYTKVVLGESKRLPGHDDASCAICLSEYNVKEMVRCIPECRHCFHAECIDEWLKLKGTCPVCRNSPSPARVTL